MSKTVFPFPFAILLWFFLNPFRPCAQSIEKNDHVNYQVQVADGNFVITFRFEDHFQNFQHFSLTLPVAETRENISKFGIPAWLFEPYEDTEANRQLRKDMLSTGMFLLNNNAIEVDKNAVIAYYSGTYGRPLAEMIVSSLGDYGADTRRNRIEFAMRFIQDIPYGVPPNKNKERYFGGVHVPPQILVEGYGDCDSKVLLFVSILIHLIPADDILFLNQRDHVLSAIKGTPEKEMIWVNYNGADYLIAETAGPGKRMLGQKGNYYREQFSIEELRADFPEILPFGDQSGPHINPVPLDRVENNTLILQNESDKKLHFKLSKDNQRWKSMSLDPRQSGKYLFNNTARVFLRFETNRGGITTYEVGTGNSYTIIWNPRRKKWEIIT